MSRADDAGRWSAVGLPTNGRGRSVPALGRGAFQDVELAFQGVAGQAVLRLGDVVLSVFENLNVLFGVGQPLVQDRGRLAAEQFPNEGAQGHDFGHVDRGDVFFGDHCSSFLRQLFEPDPMAFATVKLGAAS